MFCFSHNDIFNDYAHFYHFVFYFLFHFVRCYFLVNILCMRSRFDHIFDKSIHKFCHVLNIFTVMIAIFSPKCDECGIYDSLQFHSIIFRIRNITYRIYVHCIQQHINPFINIIQQNVTRNITKCTHLFQPTHNLRHAHIRWQTTKNLFLSFSYIEDDVLIRNCVNGKRVQADACMSFSSNIRCYHFS